MRCDIQISPVTAHLGSASVVCSSRRSCSDEYSTIYKTVMCRWIRRVDYFNGLNSWCIIKSGMCDYTERNLSLCLLNGRVCYNLSSLSSAFLGSPRYSHCYRRIILIDAAGRPPRESDHNPDSQIHVHEMCTSIETISIDWSNR